MGSADFLIEGLVKALELIFSGDSYVWSVFAVSLEVSGSAVLLAALAGVLLALLLSFTSFRGKSIVLAVINAGMGIPPVVAGLFVFLMLVSAGPFGFLKWLFTLQAMIIAQFLLVTPIITGVSIAAIEAVDRRIKDTAYTLGAKTLDMAIVVVKEAKFGIITAVLAGFGRAIAEVGAIYIAGGNIAFWDAGQDTYVSYTRTLTTAIVLETSKGDISTSIALGIIIIGLALFVNLLTAFFRGRSQYK